MQSCCRRSWTWMLMMMDQVVRIMLNYGNDNVWQKYLFETKLCSPFVDRPVHVVPNDVHRKEASVHDCDADRPAIQRNYWNPNRIGTNEGQNMQIQQKYKHKYTLTQGRLCQPCSHSIQWRKWPRSQRWQRRSRAKGTRHKASKEKNMLQINGSMNMRTQVMSEWSLRQCWWQWQELPHQRSRH